MLEQVVTNLLSNAVKFSRPGVDPVVGDPAPSRAAERCGSGSRTTGSGSRRSTRTGVRLFQRLNPVESFPGTGVGLAIVRRAMERMGGRSGLESTPGQGSRFWVEFPKA
jgi:signal transduction histidine kinase